MSDEAVKKRLQRAIRAAIDSFPTDMGIEVKRISHPFFHIKASYGDHRRWIRIVLDSITSAEKNRAKGSKEPGHKELWLRRRRAERFDKHFF